MSSDALSIRLAGPWDQWCPASVPVVRTPGVTQPGFRERGSKGLSDQGQWERNGGGRNETGLHHSQPQMWGGDGVRWRHIAEGFLFGETGRRRELDGPWEHGQQVCRARRGSKHKSQPRGSCRCWRQTPVRIWLANPFPGLCQPARSPSSSLQESQRLSLQRPSPDLDDRGDVGHGKEN